MKKKYIALLVCAICLIVVFLVVVLSNRSKSYSFEYKKDGYEVAIEYDEQLGYYRFGIEHEKRDYEVIVQGKYMKKREFVDSVLTFEDGEVFCAYLKSSEFDTYPVCTVGNDYVDYDLLENKPSDYYERDKVMVENKAYENLEINATDGKNYLIWTHNGYYYINSKTNKEIEFLEEESYYNNLAYSVGEYVITPNYDEKYSFSEVFIVDMENGKLKKWKLDYEISYNSYFLGDNDGKVYLVDRKSEIEYSLDPKRESVEVVSEKGVGRVWDSGWKEISMTKLVNDEYSFSDSIVYEYKLDGDELYLNYYRGKTSTLVSSKNVDKIVSIKGDTVYYLVGDTLNMYSPFKGEVELIKYSEWTFNNMNAIFIY